MFSFPLNTSTQLSHPELSEENAPLLSLPPPTARNGDTPVVQRIVDRLIEGKDVGLITNFETFKDGGFKKFGMEELQWLRDELKKALHEISSTAARKSPSVAAEAGQLRFAYQKVRAAVYSRLDAAELDNICQDLEKLHGATLKALDVHSPSHGLKVKEMVALKDEITAAKEAYKIALGMKAAIDMKKAVAGQPNHADSSRRDGLISQWQQAVSEKVADLLKKGKTVRTAEKQQALRFTDAHNKTFADLGVADIIERHCCHIDGPLTTYLNGMDPYAPLHLRYGAALVLNNDEDIAFICEDVGKADSDILLVGIPGANDKSYDRVLVFQRVPDLDPEAQQSFRWLMLPSQGNDVVDPTKARMGLKGKIDVDIASPVTDPQELTLERAIALRESKKRDLSGLPVVLSAPGMLIETIHGEQVVEGIRNDRYPPNMNVLETFMKNHLAGKNDAILFFFTPQTAAVSETIALAKNLGNKINHQEAEEWLYKKRHMPVVPDNHNYHEQISFLASEPTIDGNTPILRNLGLSEDLNLNAFEIFDSPRIGGGLQLFDDLPPDIPPSPSGSTGHLELFDE
ncbi:hypothetical protein PMI16_00234 [Herbaspirillum sp. CF444]|uniref:hypothetical protein n=1 Tax=Herbaspirillum sp. CF444 TaxID=1144319 RepID=UPI0002723F96|nr:hypothetical protein [Herbaspirillum sp. CF444]EJL94306.1 hypothetical protein PMI16_00234 [Herbaspirillum sp. CF444]